MYYSIFSRLLILLACFAGTCSTSYAQSRHVILISIDGLHPDMYRNSDWPCPNLRQLIKEGVSADRLISVFPSYTYPAHTAMVTGALPARSGILFNQPIENKGEWYWYTSMIKVPTLWQVLKQHDMTTAAVLWPVSVGPEINWNIPEVWPIGHPTDRATATRKYATPGLMEEIEVNATGKLDSLNYNQTYLSMDGQSGRIAAYIFKTRKPTLLAVHLIGCDDEEHDHGRDADRVRIALASVDHAIGDILESVERSGLRDNTTFIIVGDHGFSDIHEVFRVNLLIKGLPAKFVAAGGSAFLYENKGTQTYTHEAIITQVRNSLNKLPADKRAQFRIVDRKELDKMGADSNALLALAAKPGLVFSGAVTAAPATNNGAGTSIQQSPLEGVFIPIKGGHHGFDPNLPEMYTGFIAAGPGIRKGAAIEQLHEQDIAPLIAKLLGIEFVTPDGKLVEGILR